MAFVEECGLQSCFRTFCIRCRHSQRLVHLNPYKITGTLLVLCVLIFILPC